jgi:hypothetical protein
LVHFVKDGAEGTRTPDLFLAKEAFSQLNYGPEWIRIPDLRLAYFEHNRSICNHQTEISGIGWAFVDSNHRPSPYQRDALTS